VSRQPPDRPNGERPVARLFGVMLMVVGALIMALSGLCSLALVGATLLALVRSPASLANLAGALPMVLVFGGGPFGVGLAIFFAGTRLRRARAPKADPQVFD
jgi:hypothetical protein